MNTPQFSTRNAAINASASGDNQIVAAVTGFKIVVLSYVLVAAGTVTATWKSGASTSLSGAMPLVANSGVSANGAYGVVQSAASEALNLDLSTNVAVTGHVTYMLEAG